MEKRFPRLKVLATSIVIMAVCILLLFFQYLTGAKLFLFNNVVSDGVVQFYPQYYQLAELLEKGQQLPTYIFSSGWGNAIDLKKIFDLFIVMGGTEQIPYRIGLAIVLKVLFAGGIFSVYLYSTGKNRKTCIIGGLAYAFSAQVLIGGIWKNQGELAIIMALVLLVIECWKKKRSVWNVLLTILTVGIFCTQVSLYFQLVYGFVIIGYVVMTWWIGYNQENKKRKIDKKIEVFAGVVSVLIISVGVWFLYSQLVSVFQSYRVQSGIAQWTEKWKDTFTVHNIKECITVYLRSLSPTMLGVSGIEMWYGEGPGAYCEAGSYYCGLLMFLMVPQAYGKEKKRNIAYTLLLTAVGILTFFPAIRLVANGFANTYFKLTRMFGILVILWIAVQALHDVMEDRDKLRLKRLWITVAVLLFPMIILSVWKYQGKIYLQDMITVLIFVLIYAVVLTVYKKRKKEGKALKYCLVFLVCIEVVTINYRFINNTDAITAEEWENSYYQDGTIEAVEEIKNKDNGFFRVEKGYRSGLLDDAGVQGYYGTTYYAGGVPAQERTDFIVNLGLPALWNQRGYCGGAYGNAAAEVLFADRYALARYDSCISHNYEKIGQAGDINIFKNENEFSIGFAYDAVITKEEFEKYDYQDRRDIILQSCVVENGSSLLKEFDEVKNLQTTEAEPLRSLEIENYELNTGINIEMIRENETVVVEVENAEEECLNVVWSTPEEAWKENRERIVSIYEEYGRNELVLDNQAGTTMFVIQPFSTKELTTVDKVTIKVYNTEDFYKVYEQSVEKLQESVLQLEEWSDTYMKGNISVDSKKLLYLSIPYSKDWTYLVDGEEVPAERVNYAFTGLVLEPGEHEVEMIYGR